MSQRSSEAAGGLENRTPREVRSLEGDAVAHPSAKEPRPPANQPADNRRITDRLARVERSNRLLTYGVILLGAVCAFLVFGRGLNDDVVVQQQLMESKELKLLDNEGNPRLFLRMYSRVPVLQILDVNGKPRMSLGLRFDDTPFIDLSDRTGRTRATFEMTEDDAPALRLFDEHGRTTFNIN